MKKIIHNLAGVLGSIIFLSLVWGSSFILVKKALGGLNFIELGSLRIFVAFLFFIPFFIKRRHQIEKKDWIYLGIAGLSGNLIPSILFSIAGKYLPSALSGMLNAFTPLFTLLLGILFFSKKVTSRQTWGILLGLIGCLGLSMLGEKFSFAFNIHVIWVIIATLLYGLNSHIISSKLSKFDPITSTSGIFMVLGPISFLFLMSQGFFTAEIDSDRLFAIFFVSILGLGGSAISMIVFNRLILMTSPVIAISVTYLIPVVALFWGILDGEKIYFSHILFLLVLLMGVYLVNKAKRNS